MEISSMPDTMTLNETVLLIFFGRDIMYSDAKKKSGRKAKAGQLASTLLLKLSRKNGIIEAQNSVTKAKLISNAGLLIFLMKAGMKIMKSKGDIRAACEPKSSKKYFKVKPLFEPPRIKRYL